MAEAATVSGTGDAPGYLPGHGAIPADQVRITRRTRAAAPETATLSGLPNTDLDRPGGICQNRDLCCRFPGCGKPAEVCDIDTPCPTAAAGRLTVQPTAASGSAVFIISSKPSCAAKMVGRAIHGWHHQSGTHPRAAPTPPRRAALFFPQLAEPSGPVTAAARVSPRAHLMMLTRRTPPSRRTSRPYPLGARPQRGPNERRPTAVLARRR